MDLRPNKIFRIFSQYIYAPHLDNSIITVREVVAGLNLKRGGLTDVLFIGIVILDFSTDSTVFNRF